MDKHNIGYSIIADIDKNILKTIGDITKLEYNDLVNQLFSNIDKVKLLNKSMIGQSMPRSWKQGKVKCLVCKVNESIIIGLFYNEHRDFFDSIDFGKRINEEILKLF